MGNRATRKVASYRDKTFSEYGTRPFEPKTDFDTVLEKILEIDNIERVRVSSAYPDTITDKFCICLKIIQS